MESLEGCRLAATRADQKPIVMRSPLRVDPRQQRFRSERGCGARRWLRRRGNAGLSSGGTTPAVVGLVYLGTESAGGGVQALEYGRGGAVAGVTRPVLCRTATGRVGAEGGGGTMDEDDLRRVSGRSMPVVRPSGTCGDLKWSGARLMRSARVCCQDDVARRIGGACEVPGAGRGQCLTAFRCDNGNYRT